MNYGSLWFPIVTHKDRPFSHHLEVGPFPSDSVLSSVLFPFLMVDEDLGRSGEVVDLFESKVWGFTRFIFQVQDNSAYPLGINGLPNSIDFCVVLFSSGFLLCEELELGIGGVSAS